MIRVIAFLAVVYLIGVHSASWAFLTLFVALVVVFTLKCRQWLTQRREALSAENLRALENQRLADDADDQHAAFLRGDDVYAIFGRFPPETTSPPVPAPDPKRGPGIGEYPLWFPPGMIDTWTHRVDGQTYSVSREHDPLGVS